ncbi:MAG: DEAD/DEAH box helicase, partial [Chloroflexota bacterium]
MNDEQAPEEQPSDELENTPTPTQPESGDALEDYSIEEPEDSLPTVSIDDFPPRLREATERAGWTKLTPVQAKSLPYIMAGRPMMVQARTGSGKTGAFILPIMELVNRHQNATQAL